MAILRRDDTVTNTMGQAISGASVYYLTQPANVAALTPLATVFANTGGTAAANPQITDGYGHAVAYLTDGALYTVVYNYPNGSQSVYPDQFVGAAAGGGSLTPIVAFTGTGGTITGAIPGKTFTLPSVPRANTLILVQNSGTLTPGLGYTIAGAVVTLANSLVTGDNLAAFYSI